MIKILFVCHGNICRSTMAESVLTYMVREEKIADKFVIGSAGTSAEEIGSSPHPGTVTKLRQMGIPVVPHRARQLKVRDYGSFDYLVGMDQANIRNMRRILGGDPDGKVSRLLDWAGVSRDVADPWYTDDFDAAYRDIVTGLEAMLLRLRQEHKI